MQNVGFVMTRLNYLVILLHSKSPKKYHKNFENHLTNKNFKPKNDLDPVFYMYKGGNPKVFKSKFKQFGDFVQAFGPQLSIFVHLLFIVGSQQLKRKIRNFIFFSGKIVTSLDYIFTV